MIVYNVVGKEVKTLVNEEKQRGEYAVPFDGSHLPGGIYFYVLRVNGKAQSKKMVLLK